jgi:site-specific DNA-methyltransferase (adenine-specific)
MTTIKIDPEFRDAIPSPTDDEFNGLKQSLLKEGCRDPIVLWNGVIIDGHNRYKICNIHNLTFKTVDYSQRLKTREDVIDWIYSNQLSRRNLTDEKRTYILGKQYEFRKKLATGRSDRDLSGEQTVHPKTAEKISKEQHISHMTVKRAAEYARAIDTLTENVGKEKTDKILSGELKSPKKDIVELSKVDTVMQKYVIATSLEKGTKVKSLLNEVDKQKRMEEKTNKSKDIIEEKLQLFNKDCFDILPTLKDGSIDLILADLPYGQTACDWDSVLPLDKLWEQYTRILKENGVVILTATQPFTWKLCSSKPDWFRYEIIWEKPNGTNPLLVKVQPFRVHENVLVFYKKQPTYNPQMLSGKPYNGYSNDNKTIGEIFSGSGTDNRGLTSRHRENPGGTRYPRSVIRCKQDRSGHPTKKPVELMSWIIKTYSNPGDLVLDNTMGEGTTGVACMMDGRRFIGIELDKKYYDIAVESINGMKK